MKDKRARECDAEDNDNKRVKITDCDAADEERKECAVHAADADQVKQNKHHDDAVCDAEK